MRRWLVVLVVLALISAACAGGSRGPSSTGNGTSTRSVPAATSEPGEPSSTVQAEASTTVAAPAWPAVEVLVTNDDGVFLIDTEGEISQLVKGRVAYAVDDTRGGLLFQVERGRNWELSFEGPSERSRATVVWWVPAGSSAAQELLVPSPGAGHWLSLHDAYRTGRSFSVLYTRSEGSVPFEDAWEKLRIFDVGADEVREVATVGGWEHDFDGVSVSGDLISGTSGHLYGRDCMLLAMNGEFVTPPGLPESDAECGMRGGCRFSCVVSADGSQIAYLESPLEDEPRGIALVVVEMASGTELVRLDAGSDDAHRYGSLDLNGQLLLVNRRREDSGVREAFGEALLVHLANDSADEVPVSGRVRFATSPLDIRRPVVPPIPAAVQLRSDGLGVADFGDPVEDVMVAMLAVMGEPSMDATHTGPMLRDEHGWPPPEDIDPSDLDDSYVDIGCFAATGYPCDLYFRMVEWEGTGLALMFSDIDPATGTVGIPVFNGWHVAEPRSESTVLTMVDGIGIGSTLADLVHSFGEDVGSQIGYDDVIGAWGYWRPDGLRIHVSGDPSTSDTTVIWLSAGFGFDCC